MMWQANYSTGTPIQKKANWIHIQTRTKKHTQHHLNTETNDSKHHTNEREKKMNITQYPVNARNL